MLRTDRLIAFTLIELLVVIAIIGLLAAMLLPIINAGQRASDENISKVVLQVIGTSIDEFIAETGSVPLPTGSAADPESGSWYPTDNDGSWEKQKLWWRLSHEMTVDERALMHDKGEEAHEAADQYQSTDFMKKKYGSDSAATSAFVSTVMPFVNSEYGVTDNFFAVYYRRNMGTGKWFQGDSGYGTAYNKPSTLGRYKIHYMAMKGKLAKDLAERKHLTHASLDISELPDPRFVKDDTIVDAWDNPIIYAGHSHPKIALWNAGIGHPYIEPPTQGRNSLTDRNGDGTIDSADWAVMPPEINDPVDHDGNGAVDLAVDKVFKYDRNNDGTIDERDWSSILWNAIPGRENTYFLGSAGYDGLFNVLVYESVNEDNVNLIEDYND